ncbi:MAG: hypothetical protein WED33_01545 [Bacteroidia bacterium]
MENNSQQGEQEEKEGGNNRVVVIILILVIAILGLLSGYLFFQVNELKTEAEALKTEKVQAETDTDEYRDQLQLLTAKYDSLMQVHEGLRSELEIERGKVVQLMADYQALKRSGGSMNGSNGMSLRQRLEELQQQYDESEAVILELKAQNQELTNENFRAQKLVEETTAQNDKLSQENNKLNKTVEIAKRLKTYELYADAVKVSGGGTKEKQTDKAKKADRIRVCFTVLDNQLADKQEKLIYAAIKDPDGKVFTLGDKSMLTLLNGMEIQYSVKKEIFYDNKVMQLCLNWEVNQSEPLKEGTYMVELYADGVQIGATDFTLK